MGTHCRLFDENLVRNIMISTGVSIMEFVKENKMIDIEDVCEYIEFNAEDIITETINSLEQNEDDSVNYNDRHDKRSNSDSKGEDTDLSW